MNSRLCGWSSRPVDRIIRLGNHGGTCRGLIQTAENFNGVGQHFRSCHRPRVAGFGGLNDRGHRISYRCGLTLGRRGKKRAGSHQQLGQPGGLVIDVDILDVRCRADAMGCHEHRGGGKRLRIRLAGSDRSRLAVGRQRCAFGGVCCLGRRLDHRKELGEQRQRLGVSAKLNLAAFAFWCNRSSAGKRIHQTHAEIPFLPDALKPGFRV